MAATNKTWIWIIAGFLGVCVLVLVALAGTGVYFVHQHIDARHPSSVEAMREFDAARAAFKGKPPLLELDRLGHPRQVTPTGQMPTSSVRPTAMVILTWNPVSGRLVRVSLPFWLLHIGRRKVNIQGDSNPFDVDRLNIDVNELDRIGPAFLLDYVTMNGDRVLVWTQ